jgi:hypothetical protein
MFREAAWGYYYRVERFGLGPNNCSHFWWWAVAYSALKDSLPKNSFCSNNFKINYPSLYNTSLSNYQTIYDAVDE